MDRGRHRKILVIGVTGHVGSALLGYLGDADIWALAHEESKARSLREGDVEAVVVISRIPKTSALRSTAWTESRAVKIRERMDSLDLRRRIDHVRYRFYTADVFAERIFGGNQLAVFPDASGARR